MSKVWKVLPKKSEDLLEQLLLNRGLKSGKDREKFFNHLLIDYKKELAIPNIKKAQTRILEAIKKNEQIVVFGDYDVDGISASTILYRGLSELGAKITPYIPHRDKEGYGLSKLGLDLAKDSNAELVITVDNGIVALEQAKYAKEIGLDLIITDHHLPLETLPEAFTIVHSTKMCGAAVAWCLVRDLIKKESAESLLQYAAIATVADMIPLVGVGRAFVTEGLAALNKFSLKDPKLNLGLNKLIDLAGLVRGEVTVYDLGHVLSPRLNAIGRLEHAIEAVRLLCTNDEVKAARLAKLISDTNLLRQQLTTEAITEAVTIVEREKEKGVYILDSKNFRPGIIGLIAGRITESYRKPSVAIAVGEDGVAKGSARSVVGVNIVEVLRQCSDLLIDIGGHPGAAGFSISETNIKVFKERIEEVIKKTVFEFNDELDIEMVLPAGQLDKRKALDIEKLAPFGMENPEPVLASYAMRVSDVRKIGENGKHLKFKADGISAIAFGMGYLVELLTDGVLADVAYYLEINKFNGKEELQLKIRDINLLAS